MSSMQAFMWINCFYGEKEYLQLYIFGGNVFSEGLIVFYEYHSWFAVMQHFLYLKT